MTLYNYLPKTAIPLFEYAKIVGYTECAFFGVSSVTNDAYACREIWSESQRIELANAMADAQSDMESILNYHLIPTFDTAEEHPITNPFMTRWSRLIALGVKKVTHLIDDRAVDHTSDPAEVIIAFTGLDITNIHVYYPDTDREIFPSQITDDGADTHIFIPRCRMVGWNNLDNPQEGWDYADTSLFQATVDVTLEEVDNSVNITLQHRDNCGCTITNDTGCGYIKDKLIGKVQWIPAAYASSVWTPSSPRCRYQYITLEVNYKSGNLVMSAQDKNMLIRLAHSKMPVEPCGCATVQRLWARDRNVPDVLTSERLNCSFGLSDGAWVAWKYAVGKAALRFGVMA